VENSVTPAAEPFAEPFAEPLAKAIEPAITISIFPSSLDGNSRTVVLLDTIVRNEPFPFVCMLL
jgi:hypothetical protein